MTGPLAGVRVLDLTRYQSGPACTVLLGDMGAEIIKVELPGRGDEGRRVFPIPDEPVNPYFLAMNHGKRGIAIDYRRPEGREVVLRLARRMDVMIENFRPGAAAGMGIGYEEVRGRNPRIVYASISAFGERGPRAQHAGFDIHGQAVGGIMSVTGNEGEALPAGAAIGDQMAGMTMATGILGALLARERTGQGQKVSVSLYSAQLALQAWEIAHSAMAGRNPGKAGNSHPVIRAGGVIWGGFATRDGHIALGVLGERQWERFLELLGIEPGEAGSGGDSFFKDGSALQGTIEERLREETTDVWVERFERADIHVGRVQSYQDIIRDPQAWENGYLVEVEPRPGRRVPLVACPIDFSATPARVAADVPELGEHTEAVLQEAGFTSEELSGLREQGII